MFYLVTDGLVVFPVHARSQSLGRFIVSAPSSTSAATPGATTLLHLVPDDDVHDHNDRQTVKQHPAQDGP